MNSTNKSDITFKKILKRSSIEKPSVDFTSNVMQSVYSFSVAESKQTSYSIINIIMIVIGSFVVLSGTGYYLSISGISFLPENMEFMLLPVFENIISYFTQIFESFSISPITIIILFGVLVIFLLEKFIRKLPSFRNTYLSF